MTDGHEQRFAALESRIAELEGFKDKIERLNIPQFMSEVAAKFKMHAKFIRGSYDSLVGHQKCFDVFHDSLNSVRDDLSRFLDAYYKVFPERADQDERIANQLRKINFWKDDSNSKD